MSSHQQRNRGSFTTSWGMRCRQTGTTTPTSAQFMDIHGISIPKLTGPFASGPKQLDFSGLWPCNHLFMVYFSISACHSGTRNMRSSEFYLHVSKFIGEFPKGDPQKSATQVKNQGSQQYRDRPLVWIRAKRRIWEFDWNAWNIFHCPLFDGHKLDANIAMWTITYIPFTYTKGPIRAWSAPSRACLAAAARQTFPIHHPRHILCYKTPHFVRDFPQKLKTLRSFRPHLNSRKMEKKKKWKQKEKTKQKKEKKGKK